jgi:hypothetical protein
VLWQFAKLMHEAYKQQQHTAAALAQSKSNLEPANDSASLLNCAWVPAARICPRICANFMCQPARRSSACGNQQMRHLQLAAVSKQRKYETHFWICQKAASTQSSISQQLPLPGS